MKIQKSAIVVEDDESILSFLTEFLQDEGFIVKGFTRGTEALNYIKKMSGSYIT